MTFNLTKDFVIGLVPFAGDYIDTIKKYNVRNADALEAMLLKRVDEAPKKGRDAEKAGRATGYQHAIINGHHLADTNRYHDSEPPTHPPPRYITANDLRQDPRPAATARAPVVQTQRKKSGGNFFRRRGGPQVGKEVGTAMEEVAPIRPPRPEHSRYERGGRF